jgi:hypothetical protein
MDNFEKLIINVKRTSAMIQSAGLVILFSIKIFNIKKILSKKSLPTSKN